MEKIKTDTSQNQNPIAQQYRRLSRIGKLLKANRPEFLSEGLFQLNRLKIEIKTPVRSICDQGSQ